MGLLLAIGWLGIAHHVSVRALSVSSVPRAARVVFLGTPEVAAHSLSLLLDAKDVVDVVGVVTQPPAPKGRKKVLCPSAVDDLARQRGLEVLSPVKAGDKEFLERLRDLEPDVCVTAAYGQYLPLRFLSIPPLGTLNIHPSLLPKYRGASPVQRCLEAGDSVTGVSVLKTVQKMDAGPILAQIERTLDGSEQAPELLMELFGTGTHALIQSLPRVLDGTAEFAEQDDSLATAAMKIAPEEAACCFQESSAIKVHNKVRGFAGWPGAWSIFRMGEPAEAAKVKLVKTSVGVPGQQHGRSVELRDGALELSCSDGSTLRIHSLQPPGKRAMDARSFFNGLRGQNLEWCPLTCAE